VVLKSAILYAIQVLGCVADSLTGYVNDYVTSMTKPLLSSLFRLLSVGGGAVEMVTYVER